MLTTPKGALLDVSRHLGLSEDDRLDIPFQKPDITNKTAYWSGSLERLGAIRRSD